MLKFFKSSDHRMDFVHIWYDDCYSSKVLFSNTLHVAITSRQGHRLKNFIFKFFKSSYFPNHMMDFVHVWYDDRYRSKFLFSNTPSHAHGLKVKVIKFLFKCFKSSYFPNHMIDLVHIWNDKRYRSKVLLIITPTHHPHQCL